MYGETVTLYRYCSIYLTLYLKAYINFWSCWGRQRNLVGNISNNVFTPQKKQNSKIGWHYYEAGPQVYLIVIRNPYRI